MSSSAYLLSPALGSSSPAFEKDPLRSRSRLRSHSSRPSHSSFSLPSAPSTSSSANSKRLPKSTRSSRAALALVGGTMLLAAAALAWPVMDAVEQVEWDEILPDWSAFTTTQSAAIGAVAVGKTRGKELGAEKEEGCNPFMQYGRLWIDEKVASNNAWLPISPSCPPSNYMSSLSANSTLHASERDDHGRLQWLVNATILLVGDSLERYHLKDFCALAGGNATNIVPGHRASPPPFRRVHKPEMDAGGMETRESVARETRMRAEEDEWESRSQGWEGTRPWVCDLKEYGATLISVFTWGLEDATRLFNDTEFFHLPSPFLSRFEHLALPLLSNVAQWLDRPQVLQPDWIELNTGFWDLRQFSELDLRAAGYSRPYPGGKETEDLVFGNLGVEREEKWGEGVREVITTIAGHFGGRQAGPVVSWREMHAPLKYNYVPFPRVPGLNAVAHQSVTDLRLASLSSRSRSSKTDDLGLDERLRWNNWGKLIDGTDGHMRDSVHPNQLPGGWLWGDMMLYELRRARRGVGRTNPKVFRDKWATKGK